MIPKTFNNEYKAFAHLQKDGKYAGIVRNSLKEIVYTTTSTLKSKQRAAQKAQREFSQILTVNK